MTEELNLDRLEELLETQEPAQIRVHYAEQLAASPACNHMLKMFESLDHDLGQLKAADPAPVIRHQRRPRFPMRWALPLAAGLTFALLAGLKLFSPAMMSERDQNKVLQFEDSSVDGLQNLQEPIAERATSSPIAGEEQELQPSKAPPPGPPQKKEKSKRVADVPSAIFQERKEALENQAFADEDRERDMSRLRKTLPRADHDVAASESPTDERLEKTEAKFAAKDPFQREQAGVRRSEVLPARNKELKAAKQVDALASLDSETAGRTSGGKGDAAKPQRQKVKAAPVVVSGFLEDDEARDDFETLSVVAEASRAVSAPASGVGAKKDTTVLTDTFLDRREPSRQSEISAWLNRYHNREKRDADLFAPNAQIRWPLENNLDQRPALSLQAIGFEKQAGYYRVRWLETGKDRPRSGHLAIYLAANGLCVRLEPVDNFK